MSYFLEILIIYIDKRKEKEYEGDYSEFFTLLI